MRDGHWLIGWGMATATYPTLRAPASARVRLLADGSAVVETAASDMGPGTYTSLTQVASETLGLPPERVRVVIGDSHLPTAPVHGGSMTMASVGSAVQAACLETRERLLEFAVEPDESYQRILARAGRDSIEAEATSGPGAEWARFSMHAFGAVFAEVAVDAELGQTQVRRLVGAYGAGRIVNPTLAHSQAIGGMVGGIGMALMEHTVIDRQNGHVLSANLAEYLVPVNADIRQLDAIFVDETDLHVNPLGVKGLGEISLVGVAPAIANAVFHATGQRIRTLPITPDTLLASGDSDDGNPHP
jgi:xanthine dehydrogenase YagR molybdenum-binding subunit